MRRTLVIALAALLAVAAIVGVLAFFDSRDDATIGEERDAPGRPDGTFDADRLRRGNVVLYYGRRDERPALRALARDVAGPRDPALVEAGQAVLVERGESDEVLAAAYRRTLTASSPSDPALREFVEYWLGRGAMR